MNFDNIGLSTVKDSTAFKKIQFFSKINPSSIFHIKSDFQNTFNRLSNYYDNDSNLNLSYNYGIDRQHTYTSLNSTLPTFSTLLDSPSVNKFFTYNFNDFVMKKDYATGINRLNYNIHQS
jgi:hypothetical protein